MTNKPKTRAQRASEVASRGTHFAFTFPPAFLITLLWSPWVALALTLNTALLAEFKDIAHRAGSYEWSKLYASSNGENLADVIFYLAGGAFGIALAWELLKLL